MIRTSRRLIILLVMCGQLACATTDCRRPASPDDEIELVSIIQLIANPEQYHLRYVGVMGIVDLGEVESAIYLHEEDYERATLWNAVSMEARASDYPNTDGHYSSVRGCFVADDHGHLGSFVGTITKIERLVPLPELPERRVTNRYRRTNPSVD